MKIPQTICRKRNSARPRRSLRLGGEFALHGFSPQGRRIRQNCSEKTKFPTLISIVRVLLISVSFLAGCTGRTVTESPPPIIEQPKPPPTVPTWLGKPAPNFFGTGPGPKSLKVIWDFKTGFLPGRLQPG